MVSETTDYDKTVDILVVGSGAGGLLSALVGVGHGAEVLIVEKSSLWGGTSATSGAGIWISASDQAKAAGFDDVVADAFTYVRGLSAANVPDANIRAYVENGAAMLRWLGSHSDIIYCAFPYPDYHAENVGGSPAGYRTHMPLPIAGKALGKDVETLRFASPAASLFGYLNWHFDETHRLIFRQSGWWWHLLKSLARYWFDWPFRFKSAKDRRLTLGNALVGGLRIALNRHKTPLWLESSMQNLLVEDGKIIGAEVERFGKKITIHTRKAVILAAGGFDKNQAMRSDHSPTYPNALYSGGIAGNEGDSIRAAQAVGADVMNMHSVWAAPVFYVPGEDRGRLCTIERALPGSIMVNQSGERYLNEAASYHIVGQQMARRQAAYGDASPSWLVFDYRYRHKYPAGPLLPLLPDWAQAGVVKSILKKGRTIAELAAAMGVNADKLHATIARFNGHATDGQDPDFNRGTATYDKLYGDPSVVPNPCLAPIARAPFYALPMYPGDIGTNGGLCTDARARVVSEQGVPIAGLYAIGNNAASAMGESYPGAGVTIGPALTFGYLAVRDALEIKD